MINYWLLPIYLWCIFWGIVGLRKLSLWAEDDCTSPEDDFDFTVGWDNSDYDIEGIRELEEK